MIEALRNRPDTPHRNYLEQCRQSRPGFNTGFGLSPLPSTSKWTGHRMLCHKTQGWYGMPLVRNQENQRRVRRGSFHGGPIAPPIHAYEMDISLWRKPLVVD